LNRGQYSIGIPLSTPTKIDWKKLSNNLLFCPLGGSNEIGMNLNLYHYKGKWIICDVGIGFADEYYPGVDIILPNIEFIQEIKKDIVAIILTHAHEDHMGGIPYLWDQIGAPVYTSKFCAAMLKEKFSGMSQPMIPIKEITAGKSYTVAPFEFQVINITHSIPEMNALAIKTDVGTVMHTGDWKFDANPMVGPASDYPGLESLGDKGVLAMVCDSTNVFVKGESGSEEDVRAEIRRVIASCEGRVAVTTFASNVARLESIIMAAVECGRKVAMTGRALQRVMTAARSSGYLQDIPEIYDPQTAMALPRNKSLFICTGCQGEPLAATAKIANGDHPVIRFAPGDTIIYSSRVIPGNDKKISFVQNRLTLKGINIINASNDDKIHVSGHPAREELRKMYELVRPRISIPVHGEARHIAEHAAFAKSLGVPQTVCPENGVVIDLTGEKPLIVGFVKSGYMCIDGQSIIDADSVVMKVRRKLKQNGAVLVSLVVDKQLNLLAEPVVSAPGSLDDDVDGSIFDAISNEITAALDKIKFSKKSSESTIRDTASAAARRVIRAELDKRPIVQVHILKV